MSFLLHKTHGFRLTSPIIFAVLLVTVVSCGVPESMSRHKEVNLYEGGISLTLSGVKKVGVDVVAELLANGEAHVVVSLRPPALPEGGKVNQEIINREVSRLQDRVLAELDPSDYRNRQRYSAVPALAGTIYTLKGLIILMKHPDVLRIDMDIGGGGH